MEALHAVMGSKTGCRKPCEWPKSSRNQGDSKDFDSSSPVSLTVPMLWLLVSIDVATTYKAVERVPQ